MKKNILFMFMAAAVWSSCSKNEIESPVIDDTNEIKVSSSLVDVNASTRTPYVGTISSANPLTAWVLATTVGGDYSSVLHAAGQMTFKDDNSTVYDKTQTVYGSSSLPAADGKFNLSGIYPVDGWGITSENISGGLLSHDLTGTEDVLYAEKKETSKTEIIEGTYANLEFKHQLTFLKVSVYGDADATGNGRTKIKSIILKKAKGADVAQDIHIDLNSKAVTYSGTGTLPFYQITFDDQDQDKEILTNGVYAFEEANAYTVEEAASADDAKLQAYVLAPSLKDTEVTGTNDYTLEVVFLYNGEERPKEVEIDLKNQTNAFAADTKGHQFNITLKFTNSGEIRATATVTDWVPVDGTNGTVEI